MHVSAGLCAWLACMACTSQAAPCPADAQGGEILSSRQTAPAARAPGPSPFIEHGQQRVDAVPGMPLCANDHLVNPVDSGQEVIYRSTGSEAKSLAPGHSASIAMPTIWKRYAQAAARFSELFDDGGDAVPVTRTGRDWQSVYPLPPEINAVASWGALVLAWSPATAGSIVIDNGDTPRRIAGRGVLQIDLAHDCAKGCATTVDLGNGDPAASMQIRIVPPADAPRDPASGPFLPATAGAWLARVNQDPRWRLQGMSLLWQSACALPAIDAALQKAYRLQARPQTCQ